MPSRVGSWDRVQPLLPGKCEVKPYVSPAPFSSLPPVCLLWQNPGFSDWSWKQKVKNFLGISLLFFLVTQFHSCHEGKISILGDATSAFFLFFIFSYKITWFLISARWVFPPEWRTQPELMTMLASPGQDILNGQLLRAVIPSLPGQYDPEELKPYRCLCWSSDPVGLSGF